MAAGVIHQENNGAATARPFSLVSTASIISPVIQALFWLKQMTDRRDLSDRRKQCGFSFLPAAGTQWLPSTYSSRLPYTAVLCSQNHSQVKLAKTCQFHPYSKRLLLRNLQVFQEVSPSKNDQSIVAPRMLPNSLLFVVSLLPLIQLPPRTFDL